MSALEDRVLHALIHTSGKQKAPALTQVFNTGPRRGALQSLSRLRERVNELDHPIQFWTQQWIVEHRVVERYLALMPAEEQTFARLQHADWLADIKPRPEHDSILDASRWVYITLGAITSAHIAKPTPNKAP